MLRQLPPFKLALVLGFISESIVAAIYAAFGSLGICGPNNAFSAVVLIFHLPGIILSAPIEALSRDPKSGSHILMDIFGISIIFLTGTLTFSILYYAVIRLRRSNK